MAIQNLFALKSDHLCGVTFMNMTMSMITMMIEKREQKGLLGAKTCLRRGETPTTMFHDDDNGDNDHYIHDCMGKHLSFVSLAK